MCYELSGIYVLCALDTLPSFFTLRFIVNAMWTLSGIIFKKIIAFEQTEEAVAPLAIS